MLQILPEKEKLSTAQIKVAATGFFSLFSLIGIMFYGLPFFYDFWIRDFGWSRVMVTSGSAFGRITVALLGFGVGWLIDRFGPRRLILTGVIFGGIALMALSTMHSPWQFYLFSLPAALGYICGGPLPNQVLTSRWFTRSRGKAMGIAYLGVGVGGMLVPQIAKWLNMRLGWHQALMILGLLMIVVSFPFAWFAKDKPDNMTNEAATEETKVPLSTILKSRPFYLLIIGSVCSIAAVSGTSQHLKLFFSLDLGYSQAESANIISLVLFFLQHHRTFADGMAGGPHTEEICNDTDLHPGGGVHTPAALCCLSGCDLPFCFYFWRGIGGRLYDHSPDGCRTVRDKNTGTGDGYHFNGRCSRRRLISHARRISSGPQRELLYRICSTDRACRYWHRCRDVPAWKAYG